MGKKKKTRTEPKTLDDLLPGESARVLMPSAYRYVIRTGSLGEAVLARLREPIVLRGDLEVDRWSGPMASGADMGSEVDPLLVD